MGPTASLFKDKLMEVLRASRIFGSLDAHVLRDLADELQLQSVKGGHLVLREGEPSESMLVVVSGRLRVSRRNPDGSLRLYNEICPGEAVGETGMILQQVRYADVTALRDSTIALLGRESFEELLTRHPVPLNRLFAQAVFHQLRHTTQLVEQQRAHTIAVIPLRDPRLGTDVGAGLATALATIGRTERFRGEVLDALQFDDMERQFDFIVLEADASDPARVNQAFRQADQVVFVAAEDEPSEWSAVENALATEPGFVMKRKHLALLHRLQAEWPSDMSVWGKRDVERVYPLRAGRQRDYARLARFLTSRAVGVVLGGGGARGFSHLGVLRALEECGIPIDVLGGNSMGALIGAQYACGLPIDDILERTQRFALGGERPTLPLISLLSGKRLERDLRRMFGDIRIEQLWRPFFAAACNLSRACTTVQDNGLLWRAVLASNSPAGLLPPVLYNGDLLVDGAILDNVPVTAMRGRLGTPLERRRGNGNIIAVDVDVRENLCVDPALQRLSVWRTFKGYVTRDGTPSIGSILYRAGHIGGMHERGRTMAQADFCLEPPVSEYPLMAYRQAARIADAGYRHAMEEIARWDLRSIR